MQQTVAVDSVQKQHNIKHGMQNVELQIQSTDVKADIQIKIFGSGDLHG